MGIGPGLAEGRKTGVDDARIDCPNRFEAHAQLVDGAGPEVLGHDIDLRRQPQEQFPAFRLFQIEAQASLVAVLGHELSAFAVGENGAEVAGIVTAADLLDLDDVGTEIGQHHVPDRSGSHDRQFEDAYSFEGQRHGKPP